MTKTASSTAATGRAARAQAEAQIARMPAGDDVAVLDETTLAALLSSRICHDLISPIGALCNGVEFLEDGVAPDARDHAMSLIKDSARSARAKLQFYRAAFGAGGAMGDYVRLDELRALTTDFLEGGKVTLDWAASDVEVDRPLMRLLLNQISIGVEALPRGGLLQVGVVKRAALNMVVMADGPKIKMEPRAEMMLREGRLPDDGTRMDPKEAPLLLTYRLARSLGADLTLAQEDGRVVIAYTI